MICTEILMSPNHATCRKVYVGQIDPLLQLRELQDRHLSSCQLDRSTAAEYSIELGHLIKLQHFPGTQENYLI